MPIYNLPPPTTKSPERISSFLSEQDEYLRNLLSNLDEENFSDELVEKISALSEKVNEINAKYEQILALLSSTQGG